MATLKRTSYEEPHSPKKRRETEPEVNKTALQESKDETGHVKDKTVETTWPDNPENVVPASEGSTVNVVPEPIQAEKQNFSVTTEETENAINCTSNGTEGRTQEKTSLEEKTEVFNNNNNNLETNAMIVAYPCQCCSFFSDKTEDLDRHYETEHPEFQKDKVALGMPNLFITSESEEREHPFVAGNEEHPVDLLSTDVAHNLHLPNGLPTTEAQSIPEDLSQCKVDESVVGSLSSPLDGSEVLDSSTEMNLSEQVDNVVASLVASEHEKLPVTITSHPSVSLVNDHTSKIVEFLQAPTDSYIATTLQEHSNSKMETEGIMSHLVDSTVLNLTTNNNSKIHEDMHELNQYVLPGLQAHDNTGSVVNLEMTLQKVSVSASETGGHISNQMTISGDQVGKVPEQVPQRRVIDPDDQACIISDLDLDPDVYYMCRVCQRFLVPQRERLWDHVMGTHFPGTRAAQPDPNEATEKMGKAMRRWFVSEDGSKYCANIADVSMFWHVRHQCKLCPYQTSARLGIITHVYSHIEDSIFYVCKHCGDQTTEVSESLTHHSHCHAGSALAIQQCFIKSEDQYVVFPVKEKERPKHMLFPAKIKQPEVEQQNNEAKADNVENNTKPVANRLPVMAAAVLSQALQAPFISPPSLQLLKSSPTAISKALGSPELTPDHDSPKTKKKPSRPRNRGKSREQIKSPPKPSQPEAAANGVQYAMPLESDPDLFVVDPDVVYLCRACPFYSSSKIIIREHVRGHNKSYACGICKEFSAESRNMLAMHSAQNHPGKTVQCKTWANELELKMLYMKEATSNHLQFLNKNTKGIPSHHAFRCHMCEFESNEDGDMRSHVHLHHDAPSPFMCLLCRFVCATETDIKEHLNTSHPGSAQSFRWDEVLMAEMDLYYEQLSTSSDSSKLLRSTPHQLALLISRPNPDQPIAYAFSESIQQKRKSYYPKEHFKYVINCAVCMAPLKDFIEAEIHLSNIHKVATPYVCKLCGQDAQTYAKKCHMLTHMRKRHSLDPNGVYTLSKTEHDLMSPYLSVKALEANKEDPNAHNAAGVSHPQGTTLATGHDPWNDSQEVLEAHVKSLQDIADAMLAHVGTSEQVHTVLQSGGNPTGEIPATGISGTSFVNVTGAPCSTSGLLEEAVKQAELPTDDITKDGLLCQTGPLDLNTANLSLENVNHSPLILPNPVQMKQGGSKKPGKFRCVYCGITSNDSPKMILHVRQEHSDQPQVYMTT